MSIFKRNKGEKAPLQKPEYETKTDVERSIDKSKGRREKKTKEGLQELQEEGKKKNYEVVFFVVGGGAKGTQQPGRIEISEPDRQQIADNFAQEIGADRAVLTPAGVLLFFNGERFVARGEALEFARIKKGELVNKYEHSIGHTKVRGARTMGLTEDEAFGILGSIMLDEDGVGAKKVRLENVPVETEVDADTTPELNVMDSGDKLEETEDDGYVENPIKKVS